MPFIRISVAGRALAPLQIHRLQEQTTALMANVLGKRADLTVVAVESVAAQCWSAGGKPVSGTNCLAQMEAFITAGTNSEQEKSAFIKAAHEMLGSILGELPTPVYVLVLELPATDWGYAGKTQAARRLAAQVL